MALLCKLLGHKYEKRLVKLDEVIKNKGLEFNPNHCSDIVERMKRNDENPLEMYVCERCGNTISEIEKFLNLYRR